MKVDAKRIKKNDGTHIPHTVRQDKVPVVKVTGDSNYDYMALNVWSRVERAQKANKQIEVEVFEQKAAIEQKVQSTLEPKQSVEKK